MRLLYALQFIVGSSALPANSLSEPLRQDVESWIGDWYTRWKKMQVVIPTETSLVTPLPLHSIETSFSRSADAQHSAITWRYPSEPDDRLLWESRCEWASVEDNTEFSFQLRLASRDFLVSPPHYEIRRPRIVRSLVEKYMCTSASTRLDPNPWRVTVGDVPRLVALLESPDRRLPVILFSVEPYTEQPIPDPADVQDKLVGLAHVAVLADKWTSFRLTETIGKFYSCFNGAIRVYWPGFDPAGDPRPHALIFPDRAKRIIAEERPLSEYFLRWFAPISSFRFAYGPVTVSAMAKVQEEKSRELERLRDEAEASGDYAEIYKLADAKTKELELQNQDLSARLADLDQQLATAKVNIAAMSHPIYEAPGVPIADQPEEHQEEVVSVREAVDAAAELYSDTLVFLKSAFTSADDSPYRQPERVLEALTAMDEVSRERRAAKDEGRSMGSLEDAFRQRGFTYKAKESMTSTGKWSEEYIAVINGTRVSIEPHLALGKGGPDTCCRIHFFLNEVDSRYCIAHVGRHKTNTKS